MLISLLYCKTCIVRVLMRVPLDGCEKDKLLKRVSFCQCSLSIYCSCERLFSNYNIHALHHGNTNKMGLLKLLFILAQCLTTPPPPP